jgi:nucleoside-diphosphate-sugar epimerase
MATSKQKEKVLVTGAGGFIGSHLVEALLKKGHEVACLLRPGEDPRWIKDLGVTFYHGDLTRKETLHEPVRGATYVYHLAARMGGWDKPEYVYQVNFEGTRNLMEACRESDLALKRFLFVSSVAVSGPTGRTRIFNEKTPPDPQSPYGKSKLMAENHVRDNGKAMPVTIVRLPLVYGPRSLKGLYIFFKIANAGFQLRSGSRQSNLGFVTDIVNGILLFAESPFSAGETYILGEDRFFSPSEIYAFISKALGKKTVKIRIPYFLIYSAAFLNEKLADIRKIRPAIRRDSLSSYVHSDWRFSSRKAVEDLHYKTEYPLERGIQITADWYRENGFLK